MAASIRHIGNDTDIDRLLNKEFTSPFRTGYVEVGDDKVCLPNLYKKYAERISKFEVRDDDVYLLGLAKSGTTWCLEMIWLIVNNLDYEGAAKKDNFLRSPLLESPILFDLQAMNIVPSDDIDIFQLSENIESPRCIKSHLNWSLLPEQLQSGAKKAKIITLFRNPKDTCVSHYHQAKLAAGFRGTLDEFCDLYLAGRVPYGPYWNYVLNLWNQRHRPDILILKYEEMKSNLPGVIKKVAEFLGKSFTEDQVEKLAQYLSFESMKHNDKVNLKSIMDIMRKEHKNQSDGDFIRAGQVGDHQSIMTPEILKKFEEWTKKNISETDFNLF